MLTIHHLNLSQSERIIWLCEELNLAYNIIEHQRQDNMLAPEGYTRLHPAGLSPIIEDEGICIAETNAIFEYLLTKYADSRLTLKLGENHYSDYLFWMHYANGTFMASGIAEIIISFLEVTDVRQPELIEGLRGRWDKGYEIAEAYLEDNPYFGGDIFTAADILMTFPLLTMRTMLPRDMTQYPNIDRYLKRVSDRPAFASAMSKAYYNKPHPML